MPKMGPIWNSNFVERWWQPDRENGIYWLTEFLFRYYRAMWNLTICFWLFGFWLDFSPYFFNFSINYLAFSRNFTFNKLYYNPAKIPSHWPVVFFFFLNYIPWTPNNKYLEHWVSFMFLVFFYVQNPVKYFAKCFYLFLDFKFYFIGITFS